MIVFSNLNVSRQAEAATPAGRIKFLPADGVKSFIQKSFHPSLLQQMLLVFCLVLPAVTFAVSVGEPAPFFKLEGSDERFYGLDEFKDKVVFVNFWASWCTPCRKELPMLDQLQAKNKDVVVLAINIDSERENAKQFLEEFKIKSLVLFDPETDVVSKFGAVAMPSSFILDGEGVVRYSHYGFNPKKDPGKWQKEISSLLK